MSSFTCEHCKTDIIDSETGYVTECEHYPIEKKDFFADMETDEDLMKFYAKATFFDKRDLT